MARILEDEATAAAALAGGEESATVIADFYYPQGARYAFAKGLYLGNKGGAPAVDWKFIFSDTGNNQEYPKCRAYDGDWGNTYIMKR